MHALSRKQLPYMPFADGANASFRKQLFEEIGLFEESFIKGADVEICYRMFILTDYHIVFNQDAVVWEPGEPTLRALLKQRFRMGIGRNLMKMKYPALFRAGKRPLSARKTYWSLRHSLKRLGSLVWANINASGSGDHTPAVDLNIRFLMDVAQGLGSAWGGWYLKYKSIQPIPVDSTMIDDFISTSGNLTGRVVKYSSNADQAPQGEQ